MDKHKKQPGLRLTDKDLVGGEAKSKPVMIGYTKTVTPWGNEDCKDALEEKKDTMSYGLFIAQQESLYTFFSDQIKKSMPKNKEIQKRFNDLMKDLSRENMLKIIEILNNPDCPTLLQNKIEDFEKFNKILLKNEYDGFFFTAEQRENFLNALTNKNKNGTIFFNSFVKVMIDQLCQHASKGVDQAIKYFKEIEKKFNFKQNQINFITSELYLFAIKNDVLLKDKINVLKFLQRIVESPFSSKFYVPFSEILKEHSFIFNKFNTELFKDKKYISGEYDESIEKLLWTLKGRIHNGFVAEFYNSFLEKLKGCFESYINEKNIAGTLRCLGTITKLSNITFESFKDLVENFEEHTKNLLSSEEFLCDENLSIIKKHYESKIPRNNKNIDYRFFKICLRLLKKQIYDSVDKNEFEYAVKSFHAFEKLCLNDQQKTRILKYFVFKLRKKYSFCIENGKFEIADKCFEVFKNLNINAEQRNEFNSSCLKALKEKYISCVETGESEVASECLKIFKNMNIDSQQKERFRNNIVKSVINEFITHVKKGYYGIEVANNFFELLIDPKIKIASENLKTLYSSIDEFDKILLDGYNCSGKDENKYILKLFNLKRDTSVIYCYFRKSFLEILINQFYSCLKDKKYKVAEKYFSLFNSLEVDVDDVDKDLIKLFENLNVQLLECENYLSKECEDFLRNAFKSSKKIKLDEINKSKKPLLGSVFVKHHSKTLINKFNECAISNIEESFKCLEKINQLDIDITENPYKIGGDTFKKFFETLLGDKGYNEGNYYTYMKRLSEFKSFCDLYLMALIDKFHSSTEKKDVKSAFDCIKQISKVGKENLSDDKIIIYDKVTTIDFKKFINVLFEDKEYWSGNYYCAIIDLKNFGPFINLYKKMLKEKFDHYLGVAAQFDREFEEATVYRGNDKDLSIAKDCLKMIVQVNKDIKIGAMLKGILKKTRDKFIKILLRDEKCQTEIRNKIISELSNSYLDALASEFYSTARDKGIDVAFDFLKNTTKKDAKAIKEKFGKLRAFDKNLLNKIESQSLSLNEKISIKADFFLFERKNCSANKFTLAEEEKKELKYFTSCLNFASLTYKQKKEIIDIAFDKVINTKEALEYHFLLDIMINLTNSNVLAYLNSKQLGDIINKFDNSILGEIVNDELLDKVVASRFKKMLNEKNKDMIEMMGNEDKRDKILEKFRVDAFKIGVNKIMEEITDNKKSIWDKLMIYQIQEILTNIINREQYFDKKFSAKIDNFATLKKYLSYEENSHERLDLEKQISACWEMFLKIQPESTEKSETIDFKDFNKLFGPNARLNRYRNKTEHLSKENDLDEKNIHMTLLMLSYMSENFNLEFLAYENKTEKEKYFDRNNTITARMLTYSTMPTFIFSYMDPWMFDNFVHIFRNWLGSFVFKKSSKQDNINLLAEIQLSIEPFIVYKIISEIDKLNIYTSTKGEICSLARDLAEFYISNHSMDLAKNFIKIFVNKFEKLIDPKSDFIVLEKTIFTFEILLRIIEKNIKENKKPLIDSKTAKNIICICEGKILPLLEKKLDDEKKFKFTRDRGCDPFFAMKSALDSIYKIKPELRLKESSNKFKGAPKLEDDKEEYEKGDGCISF